MSGFQHDSERDRKVRIERLIVHLRHGQYLFLSTTRKRAPSPHDVYWVLFCDAMKTARNMPDTELDKVRRVRSSMPDVRFSPQDAYEIELDRLRCGMSQYDPVRVKQPVSETDVERMVDILDLLRFVGGKGNIVVIKKTFLARAAGLTLEQCARIWNRHQTDFDRRKLSYLKRRVIGQVIKGVKDEFKINGHGRTIG